MRRLFFLSSGALALVAGCGLVGTYDYDDYAGIPKAESSSSSGTAGIGGMSGMGGIGGMPPECPPEGGTITPDLCDNGVDEDCSSGDCTVRASWAGRFGDGLHQQIDALAAIAEGGIAVVGRFTGTLDLGGQLLVAPDPMQTYSYITRLDKDLTASFSQMLDKPGNIASVTTQGNATFITGSLLDTNTLKSEMFVRKLDAMGSHASKDGWELKWGNDSKVVGSSIGTTNFVDAPVFVTGQIMGQAAFPLGCAGTPNAPVLDPMKRYGFLMSLAPIDKTCTWGTAIENGTVFAMSVTSNSVAIAGYYTLPISGLPDPIPPNGDLAAFVAAYHPATHALQWHRYLIPEAAPSQDSVSVLTVAVDETGNVYAAGTFKGKMTIDGRDYVSENNGVNYDIFVAAFDGKNAGKILWLDHFGGPDIGMPPNLITQIPYAIVSTRDGLYLAGRTPVGMAIEAGKSTGPICDLTSCGFMFKLDPADGKTIWARVFGGGEAAKDPTLRLAATPDSLWLGGGWTTDIDVGPKPLPARGNQDAILARFSPLP